MPRYQFTVAAIDDNQDDCDTMLRTNVTANSEHEARRIVVCRVLDDGKRVLRIKLLKTKAV
jgi:hypothetical protein